MNAQILGKWGEAKAAEYLRRRRYKLLAVNYHTRYGEIDIIAEKKGIIAFVEVKLRKNKEFASAREFVSYAKQQKIKLSASLWLAQNPTDLQPRFDVIEIYAPSGAQGPVAVEYLENAFT